MHVHIIGGGVVGLCAAWYLRKQGVDITIVDRTDLSDGTSHGNAGMIVPSHFVPLASPGVIRQGIRWMFSAKSPFFIRPRLDWELIKWIWTFYRACSERHVRQAMPVLLEFNQWSKRLYEELAADSALSFDYEEKGLMMLYRTQAQQGEEIEMAEMAQELGVRVDILDRDALKRLEPELSTTALGGIHFLEDAHLHPHRFMRQISDRLRADGVQFKLGQKVTGFDVLGGQVRAIRLESGESLPTKQVLLAAGSWTPLLLKQLGLKLLLQPGKGYSMTTSKPPSCLRIPTILTEAKVAITPMGDELRIGGTLEISGLSHHISCSRVQGILESVPKYFPNLALPNPRTTKVWHGFRPCTPDGLPYIGPHPKMGNLFVAAGHGMMGMSLGPATGKLISELVMQRRPSISPIPFQVR